jgi:MoaA/NifB/PqqE/SkfB family radical SAM enzyme
MMRFHLIRLLSCLLSLKLPSESIPEIISEYEKLKEIIYDKGIKIIGNFEFQLMNYDPVTGNWCNNVFTKLGCNVGFFYSDIRENGDVALCCHGAIVGNIYEKSFKDIWLSEKYSKFRLKALELKPNENEILNPTSSFDENCEQCENYQQILEYNDLFNKMGLL